MSLTTCLKKMGATISPKDRAAILSLARGYRSQGLDPTAAAIQAVSDQAEIAQSRLAELSTADRQVESTPLPSKRVADTPQTETENFKRWFGDSKVVDAQGKPLVVYHGTERDFDAFKVGSALGWGRGIYFTDNQEYTREFGDRTVAAYVKIENPWRGGIPDGIESTNAWRAIADRWDYFEDAWQEDSGFVGDVLRELGYDGVIAKDSNDVDGLEVVAFRPTQIKSAIGNNGDFDPSKPSILASKRVADTPQTETENFKRWSDDAPLVKAADADEYKFKPGKKVVAEGFHGTASPFDAFDDAKRGSATGAKSAAAGHWLVSSPEVAVGYAHHAALNAPVRALQERAEFLERKAQRSGKQSDWDAVNDAVDAVEKMDSEVRRERLRGQNVIKAFVSLKNPAVFDAGGDSFVDIADDINKFIRDAKREGRDGVVFTNLDDDPGFNDRQATHYLAFKPTQIKSAIGNNGDFDSSNPSILASKRTRQDAEKDAEPTPRFNSATEFWTNNIGKPLFNTISRATKAVIANDFLKRHGLNLAEDMPPEAQKAWRAYKQDVGNLKKTVSEIADEAKKLTPEERAMVSDLVEREMKAGVTPPEAVVRMATLMTSIMRKQSQQLVETGMLSKDAADRWEGRYLPRFYQKHLLTNPFNTMLRKAYLSGIKGTHLKGRGLFETVPVEDVPAYEKMGWEVRDPERGKKPSLKGLPEGSKVRVWRDFTPAERQKMGEVRDAMYRFARGYTDTQIDIAKGKLFDHIARTVARDDNPGGSYVLVPDTSVPGTGVKKFGNLAGKYVPGDVMAALKTKAGPDSDITRAYLKALSLWKEGKTSLNPVTHVNNVVSNLVMSDLAGVNLVDPRSWKLYADTFNDYRKEGTWFKEAQKAGMFGGEWYGNEVAQWLPLPSELKDSGPRSIPGKFAMKAVDAIGSVRRGMGKMYQAEDQFFKLLLYKQARERGLEPNDAVTWANKFVFDYSTAAPGVTKLKNTLFPFANYSSKAVPALTFAATHYPWRIAKWIGLLSAFNLYAFNKLYGDDDDEEMAESEAAMMPDYLKGRSSFFGVPKAIRLPYDDESTGDGMYVDISRFVPLGDLFDAENQSGGVPLPAPLTPNNPIITTAIAMLANKDSFTGKDIVRESDTSGEAAQKRIGWLYRQMAPNNPLVPGSYNFNRIGQAVSAMAGEPIGPYTGLDYNGNTISPARALAQTFGIKLRSVDFEKEMHFQELDLKREISDLKGQKTKLKKNQSISDETLERELDKLDVKIEAVQTRLYDLQDIPIPQR